MHANQQLRTNLIQQAEEAYLGLMFEVDNLFEQINFYMDRYPVVTPGDVIRERELQETVTNLAKYPTQLAEMVKRWKADEPRLLSRLGSEVFILNEIWCNIQVLVYFIVANDMDLAPFDQEKAATYFATLMRSNKLLT